MRVSPQSRPVALAAAFPKIGAAWLVPFGTAALFWVWQGASWRRAALLGWFAGLIFFALDFAWVGHTVGHYIGVFGPFLAFGPAVIEAPFFALAGALAAIAYESMQAYVAPLGAAAAFTICEWLRSIGIFAAPFDQLGYTQADSMLRVIAAYARHVRHHARALHDRCLRGRCLASANVATLGDRRDASSRCYWAAWIAWPARRLAPPTIPVAAIQGNIAQSFKWNALSSRSAQLYDDDARRQCDASASDRLAGNRDHDGARRQPHALAHFSDLARDVQATIVVGSVAAGPRLYTTRSTSFHRRAAIRFMISVSSCRSLNGFRDGRFFRGSLTLVRSTGV